MQKRRAEDACNYLRGMYPEQYPEWQGRRANKAIFASIAGGLWVIALALPAYSDETPGFGALIFGWMLALEGESIGFIGWLANFPFIVGMFMFVAGRRNAVVRAAMILAIIAGVFSLGALTVDEIPNFMGDAGVSPHIGCYTWVIANLTLMAGTIVYFTKQSVYTGTLRN